MVSEYNKVISYYFCKPGIRFDVHGVHIANRLLSPSQSTQSLIYSDISVDHEPSISQATTSSRSINSLPSSEHKATAFRDNMNMNNGRHVKSPNHQWTTCQIKEITHMIANANDMDITAVQTAHNRETIGPPHDIQDEKGYCEMKQHEPLKRHMEMEHPYDILRRNIRGSRELSLRPKSATVTSSKQTAYYKNTFIKPRSRKANPSLAPSKSPSSTPEMTLLPEDWNEIHRLTAGAEDDLCPLANDEYGNYNPIIAHSKKHSLLSSSKSLLSDYSSTSQPPIPDDVDPDELKQPLKEDESDSDDVDPDELKQPLKEDESD
eukprot:296453_1